MFFFLILTNALLTAIGGVFSLKKKNLLWLMLYIWIFILVVIKPIVMYKFGQTAVYIDSNDLSTDDYILYQIIWFIFTSTLLVISTYFGIYIKKKLVKIEIDGSDFAKLCAVFAIFLSVYLANSYKYDNYMYFLHLNNSFEYMMKLREGHWFVHVIISFSVVGSILLISIGVNKKRNFCLLTIILSILLLHFIGSPPVRMPYIALLFSLAFVFFPEMVKNVKLLHIAILGIVLIHAMYFINLIRTDKLNKLKSYTIIEPFNTFVTDIAPVDNGHYLLHKREKIVDFKFKQMIFAVSPTVLMPRAIWPEKPNISVQRYYTETLFGKGFYNNSTLTFTVPVASYFNLKYLGVFVSSIIYSVLLTILIVLTASNNTMIKMLAIYFTIFMISTLRTSTENILTQTVVYTAFIMIIIGILKIIDYLVKARLS